MNANLFFYMYHKCFSFWVLLCIYDYLFHNVWARFDFLSLDISPSQFFNLFRAFQLTVRFSEVSAFISVFLLMYNLSFVISLLLFVGLFYVILKSFKLFVAHALPIVSLYETTFHFH